MEGKPQEIWNEISRWQQETGHSVESVYNANSSDQFENLTEDQREEAIRLWERYQAAGGGFGSDV